MDTVPESTLQAHLLEKKEAENQALEKVSPRKFLNLGGGQQLFDLKKLLLEYRTLLDCTRGSFLEQTNQFLK